MVTTEALVADIRERDKKAAAASEQGGPPAGGMGGMYQISLSLQAIPRASSFSRGALFVWGKK
jgi:hypothetical protein